MNKQIGIIVGIVLVLLLAGGGVYLALKKNSQTSSVSQTANQENTAASSENVQGSLKSFLTSGKTQKCTLSDKTENSSFEETIFSSGGKVRGDFKSTADDFSTSGHLIVDSSTTYMWFDESKQGFKYDLKDLEQFVPSVTPGANKVEENKPDINKTYNFSCEGWNADNSVFDIPSDVTFQTFSIPTIPAAKSSGNSSSNSTADCSLCNNIPAGAARDACKTQLNCK